MEENTKAKKRSSDDNMSSNKQSPDVNGQSSPLSLPEIPRINRGSDNVNANRKKARKSNKAEREISSDDSNADDGSSDEFIGFNEKFMPISKKKKSKKGDVSQGVPQPNAFPQWLNSNVPPGPWQHCPSNMQRKAMSMNLLRDDDSDSSDGDDNESDEDGSYASSRSQFSRDFRPPPSYMGQPTHGPAMPQAQTNTAMAMPQTQAQMNTAMVQNNGVSLEKHLRGLTKDHSAGPEVHDFIATFVAGTWNSSSKEDVKALYEQAKRPANIPCLQKIDMDEELMVNLMASRRPKDIQMKKLDWQLKSVHTAFLKSAMMMTEIANLAFTAGKDVDIRQAVLDKSCETLQILSYGAAQVHPIRRNNVKARLHSSLRQRLHKTSLEHTNNSHFLFGGDLNKQAKEGTPL